MALSNFEHWDAANQGFERARNKKPAAALQP
jgi:hypothetical protein